MEQEDAEVSRFEDCSREVIGACIEVHRHLGPGLLEGSYERALVHELRLRGLRSVRQVYVPLRYKDLELDNAYCLDIVVNEQLIVEVKAVEHVLPVHKAQVITYLKLTSLPVALLVNFNVPILKHGLRRFVLTPK